ncbi:MAG: DEAD/DEAH box helicase [Candidatus Diapherotrites archaeon]|uniref:DEAD/DEAH box helicase n=1 Tax=Candidatus Iainarchaeum sp. TaxID=3101447 RepID=A0A939C6V5_9ARCH|nr:DEAD/DEAH box helicase [Candidatus Diapherotrites archaeon]
MNFNEFNLNKNLENAIAQKGFRKASDVQARTIPVVLQGQDAIVQARTGSGKTAAFSIPLLEKISKNPSFVQALVLVPTRELALQVHHEFSELAYGQRIYSVPVYGGASISAQQSQLRRGAHVIVATPGRLMDLMDRGWINLRAIKYVVLDEADKMFDMGFRDDIDFILSNCPSERQTLLFSATMPSDIISLVERHLKPDHVLVDVSRDKLSVEEIEQFFVRVDPKKRVSTLASLIKRRHMKKCLVFCQTQRTADWLSKNLSRHGIQAEAIHGGMRQGLRQSIVNSFKSNRAQVLVATNLLARGMDINDISHIINFDFPKERETYVHRIGRTARFGKKGEAVTFCTNVLEIQEMRRIQSHINAEVQELVEYGS